MEEEKHNSLRIDGLSNFNRAKSNSLKTFWMLIFLCFASACCYFLVDGVLTFAKFRLTTTYRLHAQTRTLFPTVAICNQNTLNSDYYVQLLEQTKATILKYDEPFYNLIVLESAYKNMTGEYLSQEQKMALFDWDGFVISCTFGNRACKPTHLRKSFFPYKLNCLLFNSGRDENNAAVQFEEVSVGGEAQSLTMELYVGLPDRIASIFTHRGASIGLFDINEDLYKNSPSPIYISPGLASKISVKRNVLARFNAWPYLYNECTLNKDDTLMQPIADSSLYDYAISTNFTYTRDSCILYCFNRLCAQRCNCTTVWSTNRLSGYSPCNDWQQLDCVSPFYYKEFLFGDFVARNCYSLCPLECNTRWFDKFSSLYAYPDQLYVAETLKKNSLLSARYSNQTDFSTNLASNVVKFSVYLDSVSYAEVKEQPVEDWSDMLGKLGGYLHLFLGMSALSFVEIVEMLLRRKISDKYVQHLNDQLVFLERY